MLDLRSLAMIAAPHRAALAAALVLMLLESAAALAVPWLGGRLAAGLLQTDATSEWTVPSLLAAMLLLFGSQALVKFGNAYLLGNASEKIVADLKIRVYDHLQALPLSFFHQRRQGDALALLTRDVYVVSSYASGTLLAIVPLFFTVAGARVLHVAAGTHPRAAGRDVHSVVFRNAQDCRPSHPAACSAAGRGACHRRRDRRGEPGMLPAIKTFTRERQESARHREQIDRIRVLTGKRLRIEAALGPGIQFVAAAGIVLLLWMASGAISGGKLAPAELVTFLLYAQLLTRPVSGLADLYGQTHTARSAMLRLSHVLDEAPEPPPHVGAELTRVRGAIAFEK
jgi:subfamily B ATP-binding cassette protein MsbA